MERRLADTRSCPHSPFTADERVSMHAVGELDDSLIFELSMRSLVMSCRSLNDFWVGVLQAATSMAVASVS